jgi:hypothetical protein
MPIRLALSIFRPRSALTSTSLIVGLDALKTLDIRRGMEYILASPNACHTGG